MTNGGGRCFEADGAETLDFARYGVLVTCPKCSNCARVMETGAGHSWSRTFTCMHCGAADRIDERALRHTPHARTTTPQGFASLAGFSNFEPYLQTPFRQHIVWALNAQHLAWMRRYVGADLRMRTSQRIDGWSNNTMQSRLPRWMVVSNNRQGVLRALSRLEDRLLTLG